MRKKWKYVVWRHLMSWEKDEKRRENSLRKITRLSKIVECT